MSVVVLWATPNQNGLTATARDAVIAGLSSRGISMESIHLNEEQIELCRACGNGYGSCKSEGTCILPDSFMNIYEKLQGADGIAIVTAVYWHDLPECLKAFFDRLRRCETAHNHSLIEKKCLLIACAGGSGNGAIRCLNNLEYTLGHMNMTPVERLPVTRFNRSYILPAIKEAGAAFADALIAKD